MTAQDLQRYVPAQSPQPYEYPVRTGYTVVDVVPTSDTEWREQLHAHIERLQNQFDTSQLFKVWDPPKPGPKQMCLLPCED